MDRLLFIGRKSFSSRFPQYLIRAIFVWALAVASIFHRSFQSKCLPERAALKRAPFCQFYSRCRTKKRFGQLPPKENASNILWQEATARDSPFSAAFAPLPDKRGPFASRFNGKCLLMIRPASKGHLLPSHHCRTKRAARYKQKQVASSHEASPVYGAVLSCFYCGITVILPAKIAILARRLLFAGLGPLLKLFSCFRRAK